MKFRDIKILRLTPARKRLDKTANASVPIIKGVPRNFVDVEFTRLSYPSAGHILLSVASIFRGFFFSRILRIFFLIV